MTDVMYRTRVRQVGPTPVNTRQSHDSCGPRYTKSEKTTRSRDDGGQQKRKSKSSSKSSPVLPPPAPIVYSKPPPTSYSFNLDLMSGPPDTIEAAYTSFEPSVLISSPDARHYPPSTSNLIAVVSLVQLSSSGTQAPVPTGYLAGSRLFDNIHGLPSDYVAKLPRDLRHTSVGYVSFPDLRIERPGFFKLRVSLLRLADVGSERQETTTVSVVESAHIKVVSGWN